MQEVKNVNRSTCIICGRKTKRQYLIQLNKQMPNGTRWICNPISPNPNIIDNECVEYYIQGLSVQVGHLQEEIKNLKQKIK